MKYSSIKNSLLFLCVSLFSVNTFAFCGFYVAKADTDLFNQASKVVVVRDEDRTVITMASDYQGDAKDFAIVVPVPTVLKKSQINVTENKIIDHLDAYTAPRLVEYHDSDPCQVMYAAEMMRSSVAMDAAAPQKNKMQRARSLGVTIEEEYTVGEYDILILSAKESTGLQRWLDLEGYKVPAKARRVLGSYIKQGMKFFVAKVNLEEQSSMGLTFLRPIQMAFESKKFMLPIRLGTVNAKGAQDMFVFALTRTGRVETTNYRTVKIPSNMDIPLFVKDEFAEFYKAMFNTQYEKEKKKAVFLEYAWDMAWCDPCAADPLSNAELKELGVFWLGQQKVNRNDRRFIRPSPAADVYVTRLHVRYDAENFPEDLRFQATSNRKNYQGRYIMRHPWKGKATCKEATRYYSSLNERFFKEAKNLSSLTGWNIASIRKKMKKNGQNPADFKTVKQESSFPDEWWKDLWQR